MKISLKLALAYLKKQKERSISLIISISLAIILVFVLNVIPETKNQIDINQAYENFGKFHVEYNDLSTTVINKLKSDKEVTKISDVINLGTLVNEDGISINLNSYNKSFLNEYGYKLIKGRDPQNINEIVIEEKALNEMGIENKLGQNIDFKVVKKYLDEDMKNQIFTKDMKFKLVGIVQKTEQYYKGKEDYKVNAFTLYKEDQNILPKELIKHNGILSLNSKSPSNSKINKITDKYNLDSKNFSINGPLVKALDHYKMYKDTKFNKNNKLLPMLVATLVIYNMFNIILIDMTNQIGVLRCVGISKKNIRMMLIIKSAIVLVIGIILGLSVGSILSYIGLSIAYGESISLYISNVSILEPIMMASIVVLISSVVPIYKSGKISPIQASRKSDLGNVNCSNRRHYILIRKIFGLTGEMAYKNIWRNKSRTILSILSISLAGTLFISKMAISKDNGSIDGTSIQIMAMGKNDINLGYNSNNVEQIFTKYDTKYIDDINTIKNISDVQPSMYLNGFLTPDVTNITNDYKESNDISQESKNIETELLLKGYNNQILDNIDKYIEVGSNINEKSTKNYPQALISNNFYSMIKHSNETKILKSINVGDLVDIKIPVITNGTIGYKNITVEIAGILNKDYIAEQDGAFGNHFQVILNENDFKNITGMSGYNKIFLKVKKGTDENVIEEIEKACEDVPFSDIESKLGYKNYFMKNIENSKRTVLITVLLILIIASINIICIIKTNILIRMKEISTLRAIGMSKKMIKHMIIQESIMYGIFSTLLASIFASYEYYKYVNLSNKSFAQGLDKLNILKFNIPLTEILQFGFVAILICLVAAYFSKRRIEKLSIVEGLKENE